LDYRGLRRDHGTESLLFVAHRKELLHQSLATFRHTLRDGSFGELLVDGSRPHEWRHVFASVQSLANVDLAELDPAHFDVVVVDEFHHAEAATYRRLLDHLDPKVLIGLTATPERTDGADISGWFGGHKAVELRLWEALDRGLLAPFQYFGNHDGVALDGLTFRRGRGYDVGELDNVYTGNDARAALVLRAVVDKVEDPQRMRAIGFCVSQQHAEFMAARFTAAGVPSRAVIASTSSADRSSALSALRDGSLQALFTVDLFNEGIDLPAVDTILFLRPTESATVFLQQLGRGLRLADGKACLTVLDFIGAQHRDFRFDLRYRALTGVSRRRLPEEIESGFPTLPAGCHVELDRVATEVVLSNVRQALDVRWPGLVAEARALPGATLPEFLAETGVELEDLYRGQDRGWLTLQRAAGHLAQPSEPGDDDRALGRAVGRMLHVDDPERLGYLHRVLEGSSTMENERERRLAAMLNATLWGSTEPFSDVERALERLLAARDRAGELKTVADELFDRIRRVTPAVPGAEPLHVHARYNRSEALTAFGVQSLKGTFGSGAYFARDAAADLFFVTLIKTEAHFSPTTMYADAAISPTLFQWESQNATRADSPTGRRYRNHRDMSTSVHLFLRESKDGVLGTAPYLYAGPMEYRSHTGERPMRILWELQHALPADVFATAKVA
jgi:superfamily II DNA or RNA helicase